MNVDKPYTPETLCDRKMLVPIYQRLFVWDEDRIRKLLGDLFAASKNAAEPYYIGIITVHEKNGTWEIVDGQQRLTFLTLLGCALNRHETISRGRTGLKTWNDFVFLSESGDGDKKNRISYVGRSGDEEVVRKWWNKDKKFDPAELSGSFRAFYNVFEKFLNDCRTSSTFADDFPKSLSNFGGYCFKKVEILVNCLPEEYGPFDLNLYFEKMNSTGKQLEPIDVVKGKWFSEPDYVGEFNMCMNFDKTYFDQKENYEKVSLGDAKVKVSLDMIVSGDGDRMEVVEDDATDQSSLENRLPMKPEVLLLHALKLSLESWKQHCIDAVEVEVSFEPKSLIKTFSDVFTQISDENKKLFRQCFINDLIAYRNWIDNNIIYLKGGGQSYDYEFRTGNSNDEILTPGQQFQAMLYVASSDAQEWVLDAYKKCQCTQGKGLTLDVLRECGVASKTKHNPSGTDETKLSYYVVDRYWFWRLDYELWSIVKEAKDNDLDAKIGVKLDDGMKDAILHYRFRRNISIEHLHPQSIAGTEKAGDKWGTRDDSNSAMHQFGNLAMMSVESNSAQSNDGIGTKFGRVKDWVSSGRLESIKMLVMFVLADRNANNWTTDLSKRHCDKMMEILGCNRSVSNAEVPK